MDTIENPFCNEEPIQDIKTLRLLQFLSKKTAPHFPLKTLEAHIDGKLDLTAYLVDELRDRLPRLTPEESILDEEMLQQRKKVREMALSAISKVLDFIFWERRRLSEEVAKHLTECDSCYFLCNSVDEARKM